MKNIGRGKGDHLIYIKKAQELCKSHNIQFKLNTVVNRFNWQEDMNEAIKELDPIRWKVFKVLILEGENDGNNTLRDARKFEITDEEYKAFLDRHSSQKCIVPEDNNTMKNSYLVLDEYMQFLDSSTGGKTPSKSILEVGVEEAIKESGFDEEKFISRGGIYSWQRQKTSYAGCNSKSSMFDW